MSVYRFTKLPVKDNIGCLIVPESVVLQTRTALQAFKGIGGPHEGLVYWLGRRINNDSITVSSVIPTCEHSQQSVMVSESTIGNIMKKARNIGLGIVAQVHSHPGNDTRHSDGDDKLILMPFEGMFSVVVGNYGVGGITIQSGAGIHQFQNNHWVRIRRGCVNAMIITPTIFSLK
jgi:proteasome lid subunit RPN8/RPN11